MKDIAAMLDTFPKTDTPILFFLSDVLEKLLRHFLKLFVGKAVVDAAVTP